MGFDLPRTPPARTLNRGFQSWVASLFDQFLYISKEKIVKHIAYQNPDSSSDLQKSDQTNNTRNPDFARSTSQIYAEMLNKSADQNPDTSVDLHKK